jgi:hypothetical protein
MDKKEFIEKFANSKNLRQRNINAQKLSMGAVSFDSRKEISFKVGDREFSIDFCEVCIHPKGVTMNFYEMCPTFDGVDIPSMAEDFKRRCETYFKMALEEGQYILNIVIPPEPKMIMQLGEYLDDIMRMGDFAVTVYDPVKDIRGACVISEEFFDSLREDPEYKDMDNPEIFTNFLMNYIDML